MYERVKEGRGGDFGGGGGGLTLTTCPNFRICSAHMWINSQKGKERYSKVSVGKI